MRLLYSMLGVVALVSALMFALFTFLGNRAPAAFSQTYTVEVEAPSSLVWLVAKDVSQLTARRENINQVTLVELDEVGAVEWEELSGETAVVRYRRTDSLDQRLWAFEVVGGNVEIQASYRYEIEDLGDGRSRLTGVEDSGIEAIALRAAFAFAGGREALLRSWIDEIKQTAEAQ